MFSCKFENIKPHPSFHFYSTQVLVLQKLIKQNKIDERQGLNEEEFEYLVKDQEGVQDIGDCHGALRARLLRPRSTRSAERSRDAEEDPEKSTNRIFNVNCLLKFINSLFQNFRIIKLFFLQHDKVKNVFSTIKKPNF